MANHFRLSNDLAARLRVARMDDAQAQARADELMALPGLFRAEADELAALVVRLGIPGRWMHLDLSDPDATGWKAGRKP